MEEMEIPYLLECEGESEGGSLWEGHSSNMEEHDKKCLYDEEVGWIP